MDDERYDGVLLGIAQSHPDGIDSLLRTFFSFLRRRTDFFSGPSEEAVLRAVREQKRRWAEDHPEPAGQPEAKKSKAEAAAPKAAAAKAPEPRGKIYEVDDAEAEAVAAGKEPAAKKAPAVSDSVKEAEDALKRTAEESEDGKQKPNRGNGGQTDKYVWHQTLAEVEVRVPIPDGPVKSRDIKCDIGAKKLFLGLKGKEPILDGEFKGKVVTDDCLWTLEDGRLLVLTLQKVNRMEWWSSVLVGDPEIDTKKVEPENSKLGDLDGDTRATVEKMMFDQQQKQLGRPTSDELQKQDALKKFMAAHPEMDFSNAKIS